MGVSWVRCGGVEGWVKGCGVIVEEGRSGCGKGP